MKITEYITTNWETLPKSRFNEDEIVVFLCLEDSNEGWGHHGYSGYGIDKDGKLVHAFSSGCSCNGTCGVDHVKDFKTFSVQDEALSDSIDPEKIDFNALAVNFSDY
jgi:hypothetical protein